MTTNDALIIRTATIQDADAIGSMVDEFRSYLNALGDVHACVNFGGEQYSRDGFGATPSFQGLIAERDGVALGYALYSFDYSTDTGSRTVFLHDLFVRAAPRAATPPVIATLKKGDRVQVLAANVRPGWAKVVLPEGNVGYVGSIATPSSAPQPEVSSIKVVGDQLPDVTQGPFADQWRNALKQPTYAIRVTSGPAKDVNPWRARQLAFLRALRVRSALIGQGADGTRISVTLENALVPTDTTIVTLTRVNKP